MQGKEVNQYLNQYLVPVNVNARFEFFSGFGFKELIVVVVVFLISVGLFGLLGIPKKTEYIDSTELEEIQYEEYKEKYNLNEEGFFEKKVPIISEVIRFFIGLFLVGISIAVVKRDPHNNMSLLFLIKSWKEYKGKQKLYLYKHNSGGMEV